MSAPRASSYFLDSSVLAKRYVEEPGSREVVALFDRRALIAAARGESLRVNGVAPALHGP